MDTFVNVRRFVPKKEIARVFVRKNKIHVKAPFRFKDSLKATTGARWDADNKAWTYPDSASVAGELFAILSCEDLEIETDQAFNELVRMNDEAKNAQAYKNADDLPPIPKTRFPAWKHQQRAFWFAKPLKGAMLAMDMGTGKTKVSVDLTVNREHQRTLVICPLAVIPVWSREFEKHAPEGYKIRVLGLDSKRTMQQKAEEAEKFMKLASARKEPCVIVINYESAWRKPMDDFLLKAGFDFLIVDECHKAKSPGGKQSMFLGRLADRIPYRIGLTGTPMPHSPLDAYAQYRFIDKGIFGTSYAAFRRRYAIMGGYGGHEVMGYQNEEELNRKFYSIAFRVTKEVLDLPPQQFITLPCRLSPKAMKHYKQLEKEFVTQVGDGELTVTNALSKLLRLQQLTSGYLPQDESDSIVEIDSGKEEVLAEIFDSLPQDEPIVIFARFSYDLRKIREAAEKAGRSYAELSGGENSLKEWQDGERNVIGVQIQAGGVGIDLTRARYNVYYSMGFNLGDYLQSLARTHRPGQDRETFYYHIIAQDTVDQKVYSALEKRQEVVNSILAELR